VPEAARRRLEFFQRSRFEHPANAEAIMYIEKALDALEGRARERQARGVLGKKVI